MSYLKRMINKKELNTKLAAALVGTTELQLMKWVNRKTSPSLRYSLRLRKLLGTNLNMEKLLSEYDSNRNKEWEKL